MTKRFNPDFSLSISHELAYMRETPEGGYVAHGDYATLFSELESVKADRDAQQKRADALAVENAVLKESADDLRKQAFNGRRNSHNCGPFQYSDLCESIIESTRVETPATSAALAAIRKESHIAGLEAAANRIGVISLRYRAGQKQELIKAIGRDVLQYAAELREAK
ncbi:hypothetical protein ACOMDM_13645 [Serratia plymuthica]|uniref:hypothetical protein n=1 Tax=Serratia plymuthica TaxID=82996 RepID=UPI003B9F83ED